MNSQQHTTIQAANGARMAGVLGSRIAKRPSAGWSVRPPPEMFRCLESPEPGVQLRDALKQIETLLAHNRTLLKAVLLLGQALRVSQTGTRPADVQQVLDRAGPLTGEELRRHVQELVEPSSRTPPK